MNKRTLAYLTEEQEDEPLSPNHVIFGYASPKFAFDASKEINNDKE